ncbi:MAG TPA: SpoIIE family protein phosphatase [Solirubrobacteraceae bacterium]
MSEILLVGRLRNQTRTVEAAIEALGYPVTTATSEAQALTLLEDREFALIIVLARTAPSPGSELPTWLETARLSKAGGRNREVPVVFLASDQAADEAEAEAETGGIVRGHWVGALDYLPAPVDEELLRSRLAAFAELDARELALKRSEALLRGAFEAAPIGKTVLDDAWRIVRANRAFADLLGWGPAELFGTEITSLAREDDREKLAAALTRVAGGGLGPDDPDRTGFDVHLQSSSGSYEWTCAYLSSIDPDEVGQPLLMIQWVDLTPRRHAEQARAELELEHLARAQAEATAQRLSELQAFTATLEAMSLDELLSELTLRLAEQFDAQLAEVRIDGHDDEGAIAVRAAAGRVLSAEHETSLPAEAWHEVPLAIDGAGVGSLRVIPSAERSFAAADRSRLEDLADRAALSIRRAQLHEQEHRIAATLQRGLLPTRLPEVRGLELTAHYEPAGAVSEVGGDWYDAFELKGARLGIVLGDVAGKGIPAASTMGQLRSVTRAFALGDGQTRGPGDVLTRLNRHQLALDAEEMFTVLYAIIDPGRGEIAWANAGHPPPLLHGSAGDSQYLEGGDGLMGIDDILYSDLHRTIGEHDTLIFYTDGLVERRGESLDVGLARLIYAVAAGPDDPRALCRHIVTDVVPTERTPHDDVTIVVARIT